MNDIANNTTLPILDNTPAQCGYQGGYIVVMTREELDSLGDVLDDPFSTLTDLQQALFICGYRLVRV